MLCRSADLLEKNIFLNMNKIQTAKVDPPNIAIFSWCSSRPFLNGERPVILLKAPFDEQLFPCSCQHVDLTPLISSCGVQVHMFATNHHVHQVSYPKGGDKQKKHSLVVCSWNTPRIPKNLASTCIINNDKRISKNNNPLVHYNWLYNGMLIINSVIMFMYNYNSTNILDLTL